MARPGRAGTVDSLTTGVVLPWWDILVAEEHGATFIPFLLEGVAGVERLNQGDGIHPTAEGQRLMADIVWRTLEPVLRERAARERATS